MNEVYSKNDTIKTLEELRELKSQGKKREIKNKYTEIIFKYREMVIAKVESHLEDNHNDYRTTGELTHEGLINIINTINKLESSSSYNNLKSLDTYVKRTINQTIKSYNKKDSKKIEVLSINNFNDTDENINIMGTIVDEEQNNIFEKINSDVQELIDLLKEIFYEYGDTEFKIIYNRILSYNTLSVKECALKFAVSTQYIKDLERNFKERLKLILENEKTNITEKLYAYNRKFK